MDVSGVIQELHSMLCAAERLIVGEDDPPEGAEVSLSAKSAGGGYYSAVAAIRYPDGSYDTVSRGWNRDGAPF